MTKRRKQPSAPKPTLLMTPALGRGPPAHASSSDRIQVLMDQLRKRDGVFENDYREIDARLQKIEDLLAALLVGLESI